MLVNHLLKSNKEYKSLKKREIQGIFIMAKNFAKNQYMMDIEKIFPLEFTKFSGGDIKHENMQYQ